MPCRITCVSTLSKKALLCFLATRWPSTGTAPASGSTNNQGQAKRVGRAHPARVGGLRGPQALQAWFQLPACM